MPKHISRLLLLMVACGAVAYAAKQFLTPASFYEYGHYRGNSVAEIASDKPKFGTPKTCQSCHAERYAEWAGGVHYKPELGKIVKCEVCHGPSSTRDVKGMFENASTGNEHPNNQKTRLPNNLKMLVPTDTAKLCTLCHEKMPGRPAEQRQIEVASHAGTLQCTLCHNPHSPRRFVMPPTMPNKGDAAKGKTLANSCPACHGADGLGKDLPGPGIAGQQAGYLVRALKAYKPGGERSNPLMVGIAEPLSDADVVDLAAYYASLNCKSTQNGDKTAAAAGQALASKCAACHGPAGISQQSAWPSLAGLSKDHLVGALTAYQDGSRKNGMMAVIAKGLNEKDVASLAAYFANASCK